MPPPLFPTIYGNFHTFPMPMAHPAESRRKPRRDWNVSRSICFVSSLYFFVQNSDFRRHRSAVLSGTTMVKFPYDDGKLFRGSSYTFFRFFQTIRFRKVYTASATRNSSPLCIMKRIRFLPSYLHSAVQQLKRSFRPVIPIQDSIYSDQIFHQKITSFIRFVFLFCTMLSIILFLSEKNKQLLRRKTHFKRQFLCSACSACLHRMPV